MGDVVFITGFKGGVGKTTVTANIASCLSVIGKKVLVVDGDFGMRCMDMVLRLESDVLFDCCDVLKGDCDFDSAVRTLRQGFDFLPAPMRFIDEEIPRESYKKLFADLRQRYDFVLIDSGADMTEYYSKFVSVSDDALVVSMHQSASVRAAEKTAQALASYELRSMKLVINTYRKESADLGSLPDALEIIRASSLQLIGIVPFDPTLPIDQESGRLSFFEDKKERAKPYEAAFLNIVHRMCGQKVPLFQNVYSTKKRKQYLK